MFNRTVFIETCSDLCYSQRTVVAVLDQMMNPHWRYLRLKKRGRQLRESGIQFDDPLNYHFSYHILDGDEGGRPPKIMASDGHQQIENKYFNWKDKSCLHAIVKSNNKVSFNKILVNASKKYWQMLRDCS